MASVTKIGIIRIRITVILLAVVMRGRRKLGGRAACVARQFARYVSNWVAAADFAGWGPSQNSSIIFLLKAGMSSGLRLVTRPLSTTTSSSSQFPPAFRTSVLIAGQEVSV